LFGRSAALILWTLRPVDSLHRMQVVFDGWRKAAMRKKLHTHPTERAYMNADRSARWALQPSAQEVAQWCASSCAHSSGIFAEKSFGR